VTTLCFFSDTKLCGVAAQDRRALQLLVNGTFAFLSRAGVLVSLPRIVPGVSMFVLMRLISLILVVIALMLMGGDVVTSLEKGGHISVRSLAEVWELFDKGGVEIFKAWNAAHLPGFLAGAIAWLLGVWSWLVVGLVGIVLAFLFGQKHETA